MTRFQDFKQFLAKFRVNNPNNYYLFRGESGSYVDRQPSIYRDDSMKISQNSDKFYADLSVELGDLSFSTQPLPTQLAHLQHYQAPTRLLDVSLNPLVALFFAVVKFESTDSKIFLYAVENSDIKYQTEHTAIMKSAVNWMSQTVVHDFIECTRNTLKKKFNAENDEELKNNLDSINNAPRFEEKLENKLKTKTIVKDFLDRLNKLTTPIMYSRPYAIYKDLTSTQFVKFIRESARMQRQQGAFIMPHHVTGFEEEKINFTESIDKAAVDSIEYVIPAEDVKRIKKELATLGINAGTSYPDIEYYAEYLKDFYQNL
ncbi:FRG domain-containing protein [Pediococcus pentosaceus]|uniref:FRG domain-containing protein n=1 Tax=Pediococcus pentosaceus TaxID=1255 RepID=UPI0021A8D810|nr:FRG domain-containing protein [Pediococcus pentosaceus]